MRLDLQSNSILNVSKRIGISRISLNDKKKEYSEITEITSLLVIDDQKKVQTLTIDTDLQPTVLQGDLIGW
jgi:hypothetical protein